MRKIILILIVLWFGYYWVTGQYRAFENRAVAAFSWMQESP